MNQGNVLNAVSGVQNITNAGSIRFQGAAVSSLSFSSLTSVGDLYLQNTNIANFSGFPLLQTIDTLTLIGNDNLSAIYAPNLVELRGDGYSSTVDLQITGNTALSQCEIDGFIEEVSINTTSIEIDRNGPDDC